MYEKLLPFYWWLQRGMFVVFAILLTTKCVREEKQLGNNTAKSPGLHDFDGSRNNIIKMLKRINTTRVARI